MKLNRHFALRLDIAQICALIMILLLAPAPMRAQEHVLSTDELHNTIVAASEARVANHADIDRLLAKSNVKSALASTKVDVAQVRRAVAALSDRDLAQLASKARSIEADMAAAGIEFTDAQTTLFLLGFFALIFTSILVIAFN